MSAPKLTLYSYWRSSAAWRVRIGLNLKKLAYEYKAVSLIQDGGHQYKPEYGEMNPMHLVPTLTIGDKSIGESVAILEFLEETYPNTFSFLPSDPFERAKVREIVNIVACDIHPVQNLRVVAKLEKDFGANRAEWAKFWIESGFKGLEKVVSKYSGKYAVGDHITMADILIVPQVLTARSRYGVKAEDYPNLFRVADEAAKLEAFQKADPKAQPDTPDEFK